MDYTKKMIKEQAPMVVLLSAILYMVWASYTAKDERMYKFFEKNQEVIIQHTEATTRQVEAIERLTETMERMLITVGGR